MALDRIPTGIDGLDSILEGGLIPGRAVLVKGPPGSGKTTLGLQFLLAGAARDQPALYVTFEERPEKILADAERLGLPAMAFRESGAFKVMATSPAALLDVLQRGPAELESFLDAEGGPRVVVDSLSAFELETEVEAERRRQVNRLVAALDRRGATALFILETDGSGAGTSAHEFQVDGVIELATVRPGPRRRRRTLEVLKCRGQAFVPGAHAMDIRMGGLVVFPLLPGAPGAVQPASARRIRTGVGGLDAMLGGGLLGGTSCLVVGSSGTGKTSLALAFLAAGAARGQRCLFLSLAEPALGALDQAARTGYEVTGPTRHVDVLDLAGTEIGLDEVAWLLRRRAEQGRLDRLVVDGLDGLLRDEGRPEAARDLLQVTLQDLRRAGITSVLTFGTTEMFGDVRLGESALAGLVDALIFLRYVEMDGAVRRAVSVLKMRGSWHDTTIQALRTTREGLVVEPRFAGREGIMSGSAQRTVGDARGRLDEIAADLTRREQALRRLRASSRTRMRRDEE